MKAYHNDDETGVTFSDRDKEVIRAGSEVLDSLLDLADAAGLTGRETCAECGQDKRTRPLRMHSPDGPVTRPVCAECQEKRIRADEAEEPEPETVTQEIGGGDVSDLVSRLTAEGTRGESDLPVCPECEQGVLVRAGEGAAECSGCDHRVGEEVGS